MTTAMAKKKKNNIATQGYFIKRLRDNGFFVIRLYDRFENSDPRKWTIVINPKTDSLFITCIDTGDWPHRGLYEFDDGGRKFPKNYHINTDSIEVIVKHMLDFKIPQPELNNNINGRKKAKKDV